MSCPKSNAPIDISMSSIAGTCDLKCAYNFKYPNSNCLVTNRGQYISIAYDSMSNPPVNYNTIGYNVSEIRIYSPSIHTFNGVNSVAEMIIIHNSNKGTFPLLVCIPITSNSSNSPASVLLKNIVNTMASSAPSEGESTPVSVNNFTLDLFVPKKPFFSYTAIQPYQPCVGNVDLLVFMPQDANCYISPATLKKLNTIITKNSYTIKKGPQLFYNQKGPSSSITGDDIYIDCQPVGASTEETKITVSSSPSTQTITWKDIVNNPLFQIFMGALLFIIIITIFYMIIKVLGAKKTWSTINPNNFQLPALPKMPNLPKMPTLPKMPNLPKMPSFKKSSPTV